MCLIVGKEEELVEYPMRNQDSITPRYFNVINLWQSDQTLLVMRLLMMLPPLMLHLPHC